MSLCAEVRGKQCFVRRRARRGWGREGLVFIFYIMSVSKYQIQNSQFVNIEQTPAGLGYRVVATILDYFVLQLYYIVLSFVSFGMFDNPSIYILVIVFLVPLLYPLVCEQFFGGATIGKKCLGLRVVTLEGKAAPFYSSVLRLLLFMVDIMGIGILMMLLSKKNQRLGDMAGGTLVIKINRYAQFEAVLKKMSFIKDDYIPKYAFASSLTWGQISFINETVHSSNRNSKKNMKAIADYIVNKYEVTERPKYDFLFLNKVIEDYNYYVMHSS